MRQHQIEDLSLWRTFPPSVWGWVIAREQHNVIMKACENIDWPLYWEGDVIKSEHDVTTDGGWGSFLNGLQKDDRHHESEFQSACGTLSGCFPWWLPAVVSIRPLTQEIVWNADPPEGSTAAARQMALLRCVSRLDRMSNVLYSIPDNIEAGTDAACEAYTSWWNSSAVRSDSRAEYLATVRGDERAPQWPSKRIRL